MCFKCYRSRNRDLVHDPHPFECKHEDDQYEDGDDVGLTSIASEHPDQLDSPVASETGDNGEIPQASDDSDSEDDSISSDSDGSSF